MPGPDDDTDRRRREDRRRGGDPADELVLAVHNDTGTDEATPAPMQPMPDHAGESLR